MFDDASIYQIDFNFNKTPIKKSSCWDLKFFNWNLINQ